MNDKLDPTREMDDAVAALRREYAVIPGDTKAYVEPETIFLPMADGVSLRTILYKPTGEGPFPTILQRSSYAHLEPLHRLTGEEYAKRGFAFVFQFCRGVGGSQGEWTPNIHDRADGKATLDWLDAERWVDAIGFYGSSYLAFTGWIVADILPPKVKTLYLTHYGTDRFLSAYQRGLFRQDVLTSWALGNTGKPVDADFLTSARYRPQVRVDEDVWHVGVIPWYRDWITNTNRADPYWNSGFWKMLKEIPSRVKVPVYLGESWYDHHLGSALQTWADLSPESKAHSTLRIGAWDHGFRPCLEAHDCRNLQNSDTASAFAWFTALLKDKRMPPSRVLLYNIGADEWVEKPAYPFPQNNLTSWYLTGEKRDETSYRLTTQAPPAGETSYVYNPDEPVFSHGGETLLFHQQLAGSRLQPPCGYRPDVVSYVSDPLSAQTTILGSIRAQLFVSSDAEDTAFTVKIMEVFADGRTVNIRGSVTTLAYRGDAMGNRMEYVPGAVVEATADMWNVMYTLAKGSRLRVDISSSDFPQYAAHTNTKGVWALQDHAAKARQTLYYGPFHPTRIMIPLE